MAPITVVSGLPRSGTSMMMKMLEAGGLPIFHDGIRTADLDNPTGYYEYERVKHLPEEATWLGEAEGQVIKIISFLLPYLPEEHEYKIIFMQRKMEEILASQRAMLARNGAGQPPLSDQVMAAKFAIHLRKIYKHLDRQTNSQVLYLNYNEVIVTPVPQVAAVATFLGGTLQTEAMQQIVNQSLYRQRK